MHSPKARKLSAILLAAGPSSRLGHAKQLQELNGEALVRRAARLLLELDVHVLVVTGAGSGEVEKSLDGLALETVRNPNWEKGMGESIAFGATNIAPGYDGILVMPCDLWRIEKEDLSSLIRSWKTDISRIYASSWFVKKSFIYGPPAIFPREIIHELKCAKGMMGAKAIIDRNRGILELIELANAAHDLDTPGDLEILLKHNGRCPSN
jgi:molybdenum cofactor cytidylyltransferase